MCMWFLSVGGEGAGGKGERAEVTWVPGGSRVTSEARDKGPCLMGEVEFDGHLLSLNVD